MGHATTLTARRLAALLIMCIGLGFAPAASRAAPGEPLAPAAPVALYPQSNSNIFGVEIDFITPEWGSDFVTETETRWVRRNGLVWSAVETSQGARNWTSQAALEAELRTAASRGWQVLLVIRSTPSWAQADPPWHCGLVRDDRLEAFGNFVRDAVARYSVAPYDVQHYEIWNEPDVDRLITIVNGSPPVTTTFTTIANSSAGWPFGCMGDNRDLWYGGERYAKMLKAAYAKVKQVNPDAQILVGGLLYSSKIPDPPPANPDFNSWYDNMARFMEGVLRFEGNTGKQYFDGVSFHAYDYYCKDNPGGAEDVGHCTTGWDSAHAGSLWANRNWQTDSRYLPSVVIAKTRQLRSLFARYGVTGKSLIASEASLLCERDSGGRCAAVPGQRDAEYELTKAYYVPRLLAGSLAEGLDGVLYYTVRDYCENQDPFGTSLLNCDRTPRPAAPAYTFATRKLRHAQFKREITQYGNVFGYEFQRANRKLWLIWSTDRVTRTVSLPSTPVALWDVFGKAMPPADTLSVGPAAVYVEWAP